MKAAGKAVDTPGRWPKQPGPLPVPQYSGTRTSLSPNEGGLAQRSDPGLAAQKMSRKSAASFPLSKVSF